MRLKQGPSLVLKSHFQRLGKYRISFWIEGSNIRARVLAVTPQSHFRLFLPGIFSPLLTLLTLRSIDFTIFLHPLSLFRTNPKTRWEFLTPVQKTGSPLPREAIARRCARDFGLLRFLCVSARRYAAAAAGSSATAPRGAGSGGFTVSAATASGRAKLFSFYAAVVVEALASLGTASEALLRALVPTVVHGLSASKSPEYQVRERHFGTAFVFLGQFLFKIVNNQ